MFEIADRPDRRAIAHSCFFVFFVFFCFFAILRKRVCVRERGMCVCFDDGSELTSVYVLDRVWWLLEASSLHRALSDSFIHCCDTFVDCFFSSIGFAQDPVPLFSPPPSALCWPA